jgi:hypothetical protein
MSHFAGYHRDPREQDAFVSWFDDGSLEGTALARALRRHIYRTEQDNAADEVLRKDISLTVQAVQDVIMEWLEELDRHHEAFFPLPRPGMPITPEAQPDYAGVLAYSITIARNQNLDRQKAAVKVVSLEGIEEAEPGFIANITSALPEDVPMRRRPSRKETESEMDLSENERGKPLRPVTESPSGMADDSESASGGSEERSRFLGHDRSPGRNDLGEERRRNEEHADKLDHWYEALAPTRRAAIVRVLARMSVVPACADPADADAIVAYLEYLRDLPPESDAFAAEQYFGIIPEVPAKTILLWGAQHALSSTTRTNWARDFSTRFVAAAWRATEEIFMDSCLTQHIDDPLVAPLLAELAAYHVESMAQESARGGMQLVLPRRRPARHAAHPVARLAAARRILWYDLASQSRTPLNDEQFGPPRPPWYIWPRHSEAFGQTGTRIIEPTANRRHRSEPLRPWPPRFADFDYTADRELSS